MAFFLLSELYFITVFPVSGVNPVIFRQFGQYDSSPGYLGHAMDDYSFTLSQHIPGSGYGLFKVFLFGVSDRFSKKSANKLRCLCAIKIVMAARVHFRVSL